MIPFIFTIATLSYLAIYSLEAPIRYFLYLSGHDWAILGRDGLIAGTLLLLLVVQGIRQDINKAFFVFGVLVALHGLVLMGTMSSPLGVAYGAKVLMNLLFGFLCASLLLSPSPALFRLLLLVWCVTVVGVLLDKFFVTFPWSGIKTVIGDVDVDVSKDWQVQDTLSRRVAGFTRTSIAIAAFVPVLSIVLIGHMRRFWTRGVIGAVALAVVFMSTQKGAFIAFFPVLALLCSPISNRLLPWRLLCVAFLVLMVTLPLLTAGLYMEHSTGVFSLSSFSDRVMHTWPNAFRWIDRHGMPAFGVGLGGISGAQRVYAPDSFNPADNLFIFLFAYFGLFALIYLGFVITLVWRPVRGSIQRVVPALAIIAFDLGYGTVLSIVEDQMAALFLGAAIGVLWLETAGNAVPGQVGHFVALPPTYPAAALVPRRVRARDRGTEFA